MGKKRDGGAAFFSLCDTQEAPLRDAKRQVGRERSSVLSCRYGTCLGPRWVHTQPSPSGTL